MRRGKTKCMSGNDSKAGGAEVMTADTPKYLESIRDGRVMEGPERKHVARHRFYHLQRFVLMIHNSHCSNLSKLNLSNFLPRQTVEH